MGVRLTWIAVEEGDQAELLERLGLEPYGAASNEFNSDFACAVLPSGWWILASAAMRLKPAEVAPRLSTTGLAIGGEVVDAVNFSQLLGYEDGRLAWSVTHNPEEGVEGLAVVGQPPPALDGIARELARQREEDPEVDFMCDAPIRLGHTLCGYASDEAPAVEWTLVRAKQPGRAPPEAPQLGARIRNELAPWLRSLGWAQPDPLRFLEFEFERLRGEDCDRLYLEYHDEADNSWITLQFMVVHGADAGAVIKVEGRVRDPRPSLGERLKRLFTERRRQQSYGERVSAVVGQAREDLAAIEQHLTAGAEHPRLAISRLSP